MLVHGHLLTLCVAWMSIDMLLSSWTRYLQDTIYLETHVGLLGSYGLESIQDLIPASTALFPDCPVVQLPSDRGEIWMSVDELKIHMEL